MALAGPGLQPRPPSQLVGQRAWSGPGYWWRRTGKGRGCRRQRRSRAFRGPQLPLRLRRKKTTNYRNMAAGPRPPRCTLG
uniref:Macaca fascicularis brain cDNA, clone: QflA-17611 n=1 Tax=Macaca fascicularis TaxID=9541 RepID=I7GI70_MACFA|nr:unnamed protein product [Macaca fascicularis]